jgi:TctA family transporter
VQFRRTLTFGGGEITSFVNSPLSAGLLAVCALIVVFSLWSATRSRRTPIIPDTVGQ